MQELQLVLDSQRATCDIDLLQCDKSRLFSFCRTALDPPFFLRGTGIIVLLLCPRIDIPVVLVFIVMEILRFVDGRKCTYVWSV
jgi:hypothetical protein